MKKVMKSILVITILLAGIGNLKAQSETIKIEKFKVYGNCGMCEKRIEKAAKSVDGVTSADWDKETGSIEVSFDKSKTDVDKIQIAIADIGHDTDLHKADDKVYNALPVCCQYERNTVDDKKKHNHKH